MTAMCCTTEYHNQLHGLLQQAAHQRWPPGPSPTVPGWVQLHELEQTGVVVDPNPKWPAHIVRHFDGPHGSLTGCPSLHCYPRLCGGVSLIQHSSRDDAPIVPTVVPGEGLKFGVYFNDILWHCTRRAWHARTNCPSNCLCCACLLELTSELVISSNIPECRSARSPKFSCAGGGGAV